MQKDLQKAETNVGFRKVLTEIRAFSLTAKDFHPYIKTIPIIKIMVVYPINFEP